MPDIGELISRLAEGKRGGGAGPPQAFGQAGGEPDQGVEVPEAANQQPDEQGIPQWGALDPLTQYGLQQANMATQGHFAGLGHQGMPLNTSEVLQLHGNQLRANAEAWEQYLQRARLAAELGKLGIGVPGMDREDPTHRAIREDEEKKKAAKPDTVTPGGYNPNPPATPAPEPRGDAGGVPAPRF